MVGGACSEFVLVLLQRSSGDSVTVKQMTNLESLRRRGKHRGSNEIQDLSRMFVALEREKIKGEHLEEVCKIRSEI
jgi:hypothetical protein